jgi:hypothetical protein
MSEREPDEDKNQRGLGLGALNEFESNDGLGVEACGDGPFSEECGRRTSSGEPPTELSDSASLTDFGLRRRTFIFRSIKFSNRHATFQEIITE